MAQTVKRLPTVQETRVRSLGREDPPGEGNGNPLQYSSGKSHGRMRSLVGNSPWGHKESDTTERLHILLSSAVFPPEASKAENTCPMCSYLDNQLLYFSLGSSIFYPPVILHYFLDLECNHYPGTSFTNILSYIPFLDCICSFFCLYSHILLKHIL